MKLTFDNPATAWDVIDHLIKTTDGRQVDLNIRGIVHSAFVRDTVATGFFEDEDFVIVWDDNAGITRRTFWTDITQINL